METDEYLTVVKSASVEIERKKSRFRGRIFPISGEDEVKPILSGLKKEFSSATHFVWAYRIFHPESHIEACSDAGEPKGSAGTPLLNSLKRAELFNVLVVVIRWYGGQKLGIPGLIEAYSSTASLAVEKAGTRKAFVEKELALELSYDKFGKVKSLVSQGKARIISVEFKEKVLLRLAVRESKWEEVQAYIRNIARGL